MKTSGIPFKNQSDLTFMKFDDNIFMVSKDRMGKYPKNYFVTSLSVVEEMNNTRSKVVVIDDKHNLIVDNFSVSQSTVEGVQDIV